MFIRPRLVIRWQIAGKGRFGALRAWKRPGTGPRPELLVWCGAPRRNRTGDPILTMDRGAHRRAIRPLRRWRETVSAEVMGSVPVRVRADHGVQLPGSRKTVRPNLALPAGPHQPPIAVSKPVHPSLIAEAQLQPQPPHRLLKHDFFIEADPATRPGALEAHTTADHLASAASGNVGLVWLE